MRFPRYRFIPIMFAGAGILGNNCGGDTENYTKIDISNLIGDIDLVNTNIGSNSKVIVNYLDDIAPKKYNGDVIENGSELILNERISVNVEDVKPFVNIVFNELNNYTVKNIDSTNKIFINIEYGTSISVINNSSVDYAYSTRVDSDAIPANGRLDSDRDVTLRIPITIEQIDNSPKAKIIINSLDDYTLNSDTSVDNDIAVSIPNKETLTVVSNNADRNITIIDADGITVLGNSDDYTGQDNIIFTIPIDVNIVEPIDYDFINGLVINNIDNPDEIKIIGDTPHIKFVNGDDVSILVNDVEVQPNSDLLVDDSNIITIKEKTN